MRINKYIADAGIASRRKADELIKNGNVKVNGKTMKEPGVDINPGDKVEVNGTLISAPEKKVYYLMNKPLGYITSVNDEQGRPTVMDIITDVPERIFPIGRLDYNTSGLLIMTNDGELFHTLAHPKHNVTKTYRARVTGVLSKEKVAKLRKGVDIGGYITAPARVTVVKQLERSAIVEVEISEGKNRQVRKMFRAVGNRVVELERMAIGEIIIGRLKVGHYRKLSREEVQYLKNL